MSALIGLGLYLAAFTLAFGARALGRFVVARRAGVNVERLVIGAGRSLGEWKAGGSVPAVELRLFPFCLRLVFAGMPADAPAERGTFVAASSGARFLVVLTGLLSMYALGAGCSFAAERGAGGRLAATTIVDVVPGGEADRAGLRDGDRIVEVRGEPVPRWSDVRRAIVEAEGGSLGLTIERGGERLPMLVTPSRSPSGSWAIGVLPRAVLSPIEAHDSLLSALAIPWRLAAQRAAWLWGFAFPTGVVAGQLPWPWSALATTGELLCSWFLLLVLPLPGLDGARLAALAFEGLAGRRLGAKAWSRIESRELLFVVWGGLLIVSLLVTSVLALR